VLQCTERLPQRSIAVLRLRIDRLIPIVIVGGRQLGGRRSLRSGTKVSLSVYGLSFREAKTDNVVLRLAPYLYDTTMSAAGNKGQMARILISRLPADLKKNKEAGTFDERRWMLIEKNAE